jgi:hypothetical protein
LVRFAARYVTYIVTAMIAPKTPNVRMRQSDETACANAGDAASTVAMAPTDRTI